MKLRNGTVSIASWNNDKTASVTVFSSDGRNRSIESHWTPQHPNVPYDGFYNLGRDCSIPFTISRPRRVLAGHAGPIIEPRSRRIVIVHGPFAEIAGSIAHTV